MAVIINEFEIVPEPPPTDPDPVRNKVKSQDVKLSPEDVVSIQRRERVRVDRVRAD